MSSGLPSAVTARLEDLLHGQPRAPLADAAALLSASYRGQASSTVAIPSRDAALAYALVRLPATYASIQAALLEAARLAPDLGPRTAYDLGFGTGAAALAACDIWPSLSSVIVTEPNAHLRSLGVELASAVGLGTSDAESHTTADVALMSYVQVECDVATAAGLVRRCLAAATDLAVFVEPGTMAGFHRIRATRDIVAAAGWHILAPCPHGDVCPLPHDDWCHFKTRLPRSKVHRELKGGAAPFEDEPFSYVIATPIARTRAAARILRSPIVRKPAVEMVACTVQGVSQMVVPRRDKPAFAAARRAEAGDPWPQP